MPDTPSFDLKDLKDLKEAMKEVKEKARASATVSGIFLAFSASFFVVVLGKDFANALDILCLITPGKWDWLTFLRTGVPALAGIMLPVLTLLSERWVSAARYDTLKKSETRNRLRARRYLILALLIVILLVGAFCVARHPSVESGHSLAFSGVALIFISLLLLVLSVEFYDSAGGFSSNLEYNLAYHFHMANIASHCYVLGLSTGVVGISS